MTTFNKPLALLCIAFAVCARTVINAQPSGLKKTDDALAKVQGDWRVVAHTFDGKDIPAGLGEVIYSIQGNHLIHIMNKRPDATLRLDPSKDPSEWDAVSYSGITNTDIYKLEGAELTICGGLRGAERPKTFAAGKGSRISLMVLTRLKLTALNAAICKIDVTNKTVRVVPWDGKAWQKDSVKVLVDRKSVV